MNLGLTIAGVRIGIWAFFLIKVIAQVHAIGCSALIPPPPSLHMASQTRCTKVQCGPIE